MRLPTRPSPYSRFVYVDLVNRRDSVLKKVKLALIDSVFAGYLKVPEDIRQGEYFLRSYSYWMQNLGEDYIYKKRIHLIQSVGFEGVDQSHLPGRTRRKICGCPVVEFPEGTLPEAGCRLSVDR